MVEVHPNLENLRPGTGIFNCEICFGHWLDREPIEAYLAKQNQVKVAEFRSVWHSKPQSDSALKCPRDQNQFGIINYGAIDLDVCPSCRGLWFDALELEVVTGDRASMKVDSGEQRRIVGIDVVDIVGEIFGAVFGGGW